MKVPAKVKQSGLRKWRRPLKIGRCDNGRKRRGSKALAFELSTWWKTRGAFPCSFCDHFDTGVIGESAHIDFPHCHNCPLKSAGHCAQPWMALEQMMTKADFAPAQCTTFLAHCQDMLDLIEAVETE